MDGHGKTDSEVDTPGIKIKNIELADGTVHDLPTVGVTAIVGGNNTGKSSLLRQISQRLHSAPEYSPPLGEYAILKRLQLEVTGTHSNFIAWIRKNATLRKATASNPGIQEGYVRPGTGSIDAAQIEHSWYQIEKGRIDFLAPFLVKYAEAGGRSMQSFSVSQRARPGDPATSSIHHLEDDDVLREKVDNLFFDIFNQHLTLDKLGTSVTLRVGEPPLGLERLAYYDNAAQMREQMDELRPLDAQGDGMRALMGLLLPVITATYPIMIYDEPEAFLHPPQAVALGRILGKLAEEVGVQVILATHDRNILIGLLQSDAPLAVVRLTRKGDSSSSYRLDPDQIKQIWSDPVLKYSHVLDGLFHSRVVVAESERDCTFYAAAMDAAQEERPLSVPPSEVLFVPTGGKDGMATVVAALAKLKVPVVATPDIDMLNDKTKMRRLMEALGRDWSDYEEDYNACTSKFRQARGPAMLAHIASSIKVFLDDALRNNPMRFWDETLRDELKSLTRASDSPWGELKKYGVAAFPKEVDGRAASFLNRMDEAGLVLVRVGELECFASGYQIVERKGINWLRAAFEAGVHKSDAAKSHVRRLVSVPVNVD